MHTHIIEFFKFQTLKSNRCEIQLRIEKKSTSQTFCQGRLQSHMNRYKSLKFKLTQNILSCHYFKILLTFMSIIIVVIIIEIIVFTIDSIEWTMGIGYAA